MKSCLTRVAYQRSSLIANDLTSSYIAACTKTVIRLQKESAPKQASVFTMEQIEMFVLNAPETLDIRIKKIAALVAIQGALRISEVVNIGYDDVTFLNNGSMNIRIKCSKTDQAGKRHSFIITPNVNAQSCAVLRMRTYMELIETKNGRLFRSATKAVNSANSLSE